MASSFSIFVRDFDDKSLCVTVSASETLEDVKNKLQDRLGIPSTEQLLFPLAHCFDPYLTLADLKVGSNSLLQLSGRLRGGKGGFGSLLRGSRKASQTENEDACRDLSGRRIRVATAEKKLQDWAAAEEQRKRDKQTAKEERDRAKAERRAENAQVDTEAIRQEQRATLSSLQRALDSSMKAGVKRAAAETAKPAIKKPRYQSESEEAESNAGSSSDSEDEAPTTANQEKASEAILRTGRSAQEVLPAQTSLQAAVR